MGQANSVSSLSSTTSSQFHKTKLPEFILKSKNLTFAFGQKPNLVAHTTIVVVFDGIPKFTIDFGTDRKDEFKATLCHKRPATVNVNTYDENQIEIRFIMESFSIEDDFQKDIAGCLFEILLTIPVQCYDLIEYNCRDYVTAAILVIQTFASQNWENFDWDCLDPELLKEIADVCVMESDDPEMLFLRDVKKSDEIKLRNGTKIVAGSLGGVGGALTIGGGTLAKLAVAGDIVLTKAAVTVTAGCLTGGVAMIAGALVVTVPIWMKMAKNRRQKEE